MNRILKKKKKDTEKLDHSYMANGHVKSISHSRKQFGSFLNKLHLSYDSAIVLLGIYTREMKT